MNRAVRLEMLQLPFPELMIHPVVLWDEDSAVLIDTGLPGQIEELEREMGRVGLPPRKLSAVLLTHQDLDHIGSLPELLNRYGGNIQVFAHELDRPYIQGELPLLKDGQLESPPRGRVDAMLGDGQELPFCGGITVIHTPGHTPGHVSFYVKSEKTLIAGDAMYSVNGKLGGVHAPSAYDVDAANRSLAKFLDFDIESVVCYHGGLSRDQVRDQLERIIIKP